MSKYTTEVRFICENYSGLRNSVDYPSIDEVLDRALPKVFDFAFPIFDENYRSVLEKKILKHYYTREIGEETVALWKFRLNTKLNEIMPYYNKLYNSELLDFNPLYTVNLTRDKNTDFDSTKTGTESITDNTTSSQEKEYGYTKELESDGASGNVNTVVSGSDTTGSGTNGNTKYELYSDTPQGALNGVESGTYLTNAKKSTDDGETSSESHSQGSESATGSGTTHDEGSESVSGTDSTSGSVGYTRSKGDSNVVNSTEDYLEHVVGYEGTNGSKMLKDWRETFLNIDMMVIQELEPLFFQLW